MKFIKMPHNILCSASGKNLFLTLKWGKVQSLQHRLVSNINRVYMNFRVNGNVDLNS